jgi:hypothetical protein
MSAPERAAEFAWRAHGAITDWTAKVDVKASIMLTLEIAGVGALVTLSQPHGLLGHLTTGALWLYRVGIVVIAAAIVLAGGVVFPRLGSHSAKKDPTDGLIYFGHLRAYEPAALKDRLERLTPHEELDQLSHQLVQTSRIAWLKHRWLQGSVLAALLGAVIVTLARLWQ